MQLESETQWLHWLSTHAERLRLLYRLQEEALHQQDWQTFVQLSLQREQILEPLWHASPGSLPDAVMALVEELWQANQRLQQMIEAQREALHHMAAHTMHQQRRLRGYHSTYPAGALHDCSG